MWFVRILWEFWKDIEVRATVSIISETMTQAVGSIIFYPEHCKIILGIQHQNLIQTQKNEDMWSKKLKKKRQEEFIFFQGFRSIICKMVFIELHACEQYLRYCWISSIDESQELGLSDLFRWDVGRYYPPGLLQQVGLFQPQLRWNDHKNEPK